MQQELISCRYEIILNPFLILASLPPFPECLPQPTRPLRSLARPTFAIKARNLASDQLTGFFTCMSLERLEPGNPRYLAE